jgi:vanillate O-demethylase monooxygenase subunit
MIWLKNVWYVAGFNTELNGTNMVARRFLDTPVVMFKTSDGQLAALEDLCPHRLMPLSAGKRVGDELQCGYHGLKFSVAGLCTEAPGQEKAPSKACVRSYPLVARHGLLFIWLGDPSLADKSLIPDIHWNDDPAWAASRGYHYLKSDFRLANDNLLDLSHETYIHMKTIGNDEEETISSFPLKTAVEGDALVTAHREMPSIEPPPFFAMILDHKGRIDRWQTAINVAPCYNMTDVGVYPIDTSREGAFRMHVLHLLTPETETTTHYFWALTRNYRLTDEALTATIQQAISDTFDEDSVVLEIQQKQIEKYGGAIPRVALKLDDAPLKARRVLAALIKREEEDPNFVLRPPVMVREQVPEAA